ncbi:hypothetical protein THIOSC15_2520007 [uncultured Thiomicrorhabdus sp.]
MAKNLDNKIQTTLKYFLYIRSYNVYYVKFDYLPINMSYSFHYEPTQSK